MSIICRVFLLQVCIQAFFPVKADWTATMPRSLVALKHSCLVIPCMFNYPGQSKPGSDITAIWYQKDNVELYHNAKSETKSRAELVGDLGLKNCSLWIKSVKKEDDTEYTFRVEIQNLDKYTFHSTTHVIVQDTPTAPQLLSYRRNMSEGDLLTVTCKTTHTCIVNPPNLVWQPRDGLVQEEHRRLGEGEWEIVSRQTFLVSASHHNKDVRCEAQYPSGQEARTTGQTLSVLYAPKNTSVRITDGKETMEEGGSVSLMCSSNSNPPATSFTWYRMHRKRTLLRLPASGHILQVISISRTDPSYFCMAKNELGAQNSTLLHLDILYKPEILPESSCVIQYSQFECQCLVQSNPLAVITWHLLDRTVTQTDLNFSFNISVNGSITRSRLVGPTSLGANISCAASNKLGVTQLELPRSGYQPWIVPVVAVSGALLFLLFAAAVIRHICKRRKKDQCEKDKGITVVAPDRKENTKHDIYSRQTFPKANSMELYANMNFAERSAHKQYDLGCDSESSEKFYQMVFPNERCNAVYKNC